MKMVSLLGFVLETTAAQFSSTDVVLAEGAVAAVPARQYAYT